MNTRTKQRKFGWIVWVLCAIVLLGLIPRAVELINHNYLFGFDQGLFYEKVRRIAVDHKLTLIGEEVGGRGGFFQGPGFYYLLTVPFVLFRGDPYGGTVLMFLAGLATLAAAAALSLKMLGKREAVFVTMLMAFSPAMVAQSRFVWNPFFVPLITVFILTAFYATLRKRVLLPVVFALIGMLFHFEIATGIMMFVQYFLFTLFLLVRKRVGIRDVLFSAVAFAVPLGNFALFDLRHDFLITRGILGYAGGNYPHTVTQTYVIHMLGNHFDVFRNQFLSTFPYGAYLWPVIVTVIIAGVIGMMRDKRVEPHRREFVAFLFLSPVLMFALYMRYLWPMWEWWILELGVVYCMLLGLVLSWGWQKGTWYRVGIAMLSAVILFAHIQSTVRFYRTDFTDYGGTHKIRGKLDAIDFIYRDAAGKPFTLLVFSPPVYTYPYDYLVRWHGKRAYGYLPGTEKKGLGYLLIEPDPQKPWSYKGWLETVVKTGKTVSSWELPSGFIVEKREFE